MEVDGFSPRLKRKEVEDVRDDFSDFSLSSPARKIRRLDAELPPIIDEGECDISVEFEQSMPYEQMFGGNSTGGGIKIEDIPSDCNSTGGVKIEELSNEPRNEERAIVLFNSINNNLLLQSPSNFSINPHLISRLKNQQLWSDQVNSWRVGDDKAADNDNTGSDKGRLAMVPWVPSQFSPADFPQTDNCEMMDAQVLGEANMDVEDSTNIDQNNFSEAGGMSLGEQPHQWQPQPQHCLIPQPSHSTTTPIAWYHHP